MPAATAKATKKSVFETLNEVDVSGKVEHKGNLSYLSWAWAWAELKKRYPKSFYTIYENEQGYNYFTDGRTCWVKTGLTVVDDDFQQEHIEYLPIMNMRNQSLSLENVTSMDVNKAIQRSLTKAAARHGLGLYIYAGEDMPEATAAEAREREAALSSIRNEITKEIARCVRAGQENAMTLDEQRDFANTYVKPIIGNGSYKTCTDEGKLSSLLEALKKAA